MNAQITLAATDYGPFTNLVRDAGSIVAAVAAIGLTWRGRAKWEPSEEDVAEGPQKVGGVVSVALVTVVWATFRTDPSSPVLKVLLVIAAAAAFVLLLVYGWLIAVYTFNSVEIDDAGKAHTTKIIGSWKLTPQAKAAIDLPTTAQDTFAGMGYDPDKVWPRGSRALTKSLFVTSYIGLVVSGTFAIAASSIIAGG